MSQSATSDANNTEIPIRGSSPNKRIERAQLEILAKVEHKLAEVRAPRLNIHVWCFEVQVSLQLKSSCQNLTVHKNSS